MDKNIMVTALVGQSGTGKSHHAVMVARSVGAQAIIDDGLLIIGNKVAAGSSAKKEKTMLSSVKRALFSDPAHVAAVKEAIEKSGIESILILGTSEAMTDRIAGTLGLGAVSRHIHIEEISSPEDIETARRLRRTEGKHIIPVPTLEIKKDFSGYFLHPLRIFRRSKGKKEEIADKTVMRPTYSYMGDYTISDNAIAQTAVFEAKKIDGVVSVYSASVVNDKSNTEINITVSLKFGTVIPEVCKEITAAVTAIVDKMTAINVNKVNIVVKEYKFE